MGRLIDADVLIKAIQQHMVKINSLFEEEKTVVEIIEEQPTAYDISKVVAELEEMIKPKQFYFCKYVKGGCKYIDDDKKDCMECVVEHAIDIVRKGGVE